MFDAPVAEPVQRRIHGDAVKPCCEARRRKIRLTRSIHSQKHVLCKLFSNRLIVNHPIKELHNGSSVHKQKEIEGGSVPGLYAQHQNCASVFHGNSRYFQVYGASAAGEVKSEQRIVKNVKAFRKLESIWQAVRGFKLNRDGP